MRGRRQFLSSLEPADEPAATSPATPTGTAPAQSPRSTPRSRGGPGRGTPSGHGSGHAAPRPVDKGKDGRPTTDAPTSSAGPSVEELAKIANQALVQASLATAHSQKLERQVSALQARVERLEAEAKQRSIPTQAARLEASMAAVSKEARNQATTLAKSIKSIWSKLETLTTPTAAAVDTDTRVAICRGEGASVIRRSCF